MLKPQQGRKGPRDVSYLGRAGGAVGGWLGHTCRSLSCEPAALVNFFFVSAVNAGKKTPTIHMKVPLTCINPSVIINK